jgi:predicted enzyme related to lactoylglutathione lyase
MVSHVRRPHADTSVIRTLLRHSADQGKPGAFTARRAPDPVSSFLNIRVEDVQAVYAEWSARGAQFLTPPKQHQYEIRCYIRDPDGYLIEVGQTTNPEGDWVSDRSIRPRTATSGRLAG